MHEPSDRALVLRTREGEVDAYGDLVHRYQSVVYNTCYRLCGDRGQAEDFAQETFLRAFNRLDTYDLQRPFGPWIRKVATNLCLNQLDKERHHRQVRDLDDEIEPGDEPGRSNPDRILERDTAALQVRAAILQLPPHQRAVIEMRHYQDLSYEDIAQSLGVSLSKVKTDLLRARQALAKILKE